MASFETQIDALTGIGTGNATIQGYMNDWLTSGARQVIDILPMSRLDRMAEIASFTSSVGVEDSKILHVLRKDASNNDYLMPCREIHASQAGRALDPDYMEYATSSDPVFYVENKKVYTLPASASADDSKIVKINEDRTVLYSASSVENFPKEANNAVMLYAARNALQYLMNQLQTNTAIDTANTGLLDLINKQIDDVLIEAEGSEGSLVLAKQQINDFVTSIGDIDDTTELWDDTNKRFKVIKDALGNAQTIIDDGANSPTGSASADAGNYLATEEDTELLNGSLSIAQSELQRANTAIAEINTLIASYNLELQSVAPYLSEVQSKLSVSSQYIQEFQSRLTRDQAKYQWYTQQYASIDAQYKEALQMLSLDISEQEPGKK